MIPLKANRIKGSELDLRKILCFSSSRTVFGEAPAEPDKALPEVSEKSERSREKEKLVATENSDCELKELNPVSGEEPEETSAKEERYGEVANPTAGPLLFEVQECNEALNTIYSGYIFKST